MHGDLSLADLLSVAGVATDDVLLVRHTYSADGLTGPQDATVDNVLTYSRAQALRQSKIPRDPPALWLNFVADTSRGELYVGKADGAERLLGRWSAYARDGHGGNVALRELAEVDVTHRRHFVFSILRVFRPTATTAEVDGAEAHYKRALLTRQYGLNRN